MEKGSVRKIVALVFRALTLAMGVAVVALSCLGSLETGTAITLLDIRRMNGTDQHSLALQQGDRLQIRFETEKGTLTMAITGPDGTELYSGNGRETTDFRLNIPESGVYTITVQAQRAKGIIQIQNMGAA